MLKFSTLLLLEIADQIPAPPTSHKVVYTAIVNINKIMDGTGQYPTIITCDEPVYALAKEVLWSVKELDVVVLRMGGIPPN